VKRHSSASARIPSRTLRAKLRSFDRKMLRASCWVMVETPRTWSSSVQLTQMPRAMPIGSTPGWERKRRSSTATIALRMIGGISS
jgi:hypothetical protein